MSAAGQRDPASSLHPTSNADVAITPEDEEDCETPSKVIKKMSTTLRLQHNKNWERKQPAAHVTSQLSTESKQQKMAGKEEFVVVFQFI
jgi:hypothetical protein